MTKLWAHFVKDLLRFIQEEWLHWLSWDLKNISGWPYFWPCICSLIIETIDVDPYSCRPWFSRDCFLLFTEMSNSLKQDNFEVQFWVPVPQIMKNHRAVKDERKLTRSLDRVLWCHVLMLRRHWWTCSSSSQTAECACVKQRKNLLSCWPCSPKSLARHLLSNNKLVIVQKPFGLITCRLFNSFLL